MSNNNINERDDGMQNDNGFSPDEKRYGESRPDWKGKDDPRAVGEDQNKIRERVDRVAASTKDKEKEVRKQPTDADEGEWTDSFWKPDGADDKQKWTKKDGYS
ncbi:uncharacterized protein PG998_004401 [Apiospora kogelbergensis]|uniref:uncharacterized protein n=1 Tax=Apiospora kogelbergensis TaxID=1337665 RepID=UPI003130E301